MSQAEPIRDSRAARMLVRQSQQLLSLGRLREACEAAAGAERSAPPEPALLDLIGGLFVMGNDLPCALAAYTRALRLAPDDPRLLFNRAAVNRFLGRLAEAELDYDRVIALRPNDHEAYKNRSELRTQTAQSNHIGVLENLLARGISDWQGYVHIRYAAAKEYEDIGDYERSFEHLRLGANRRRAHMKYDVALDVATVDWIMQAYPTPPGPAAGDAAADAPIFILGLPRTGTTLVDRILGSHSRIHSAGELNHFALCLVDAVRRGGSANPLPRRELVARSVNVDFAALGRDYLEKVYRAVPPGKRFVDKMPLNFLYCGLIRRALPNAKIVHLTRHPMAACYSIYKSLFKDGYPYSYDLDEIGRYYVGYRRLMDHWRAMSPGAIQPLSYEALVADQAAVTRDLLDFCGLEWQDACVDFHRNPEPSTTASAVQIRRPLYDSSVAQWRHYSKQLAGLNERLRGAGIATD